MAHTTAHNEQAHNDHDTGHGHGGHGHGDHHGFSHPMPIWMLLSVFFALLVLTGLTVYQSTFDLGNAEIWMSLTIATVKAALVILFFMHLLWDKPLNAIVILGSLIFVALFLGFTLMDAEGYRENLLYDSVNDPRVTQQVDAATPTAAPAALK
ncbi:MAG: cytochrome C oxidase subunit IV family protein [Planctomycetota bacterium]|jgi:cytochrome c oxidase subunit 4